MNINSYPHGQHGNPVILNEIWGTKNQELTAIRKEIWQYLLKRKIATAAEYLPGSINVEADREFRRTRDSSERKLNPTIFMKLCQIRGDGSACLEGITPIIPVHILENRPFHSGQGCFSDILG